MTCVNCLEDIKNLKYFGGGERERDSDSKRVRRREGRERKKQGREGERLKAY